MAMKDMLGHTRLNIEFFDVAQDDRTGGLDTERLLEIQKYISILGLRMSKRELSLIRGLYEPSRNLSFREGIRAHNLSLRLLLEVECP